MARKNAIVSVNLTDDNSTIVFNVDGQSPLTVTYANLTDDVRNRAMIHGIVQKVSDAAALGKDATPSDKHAAMASVIERLVAGDWNKRAGDGSDSQPSGLIFRAFLEFAQARAKKAKKDAPTEDRVRALYDSKTRSEQLAIRKIPEVSAIMERMKSERGSKGDAVDADALFAELEA